jgi:L,D-peptidoglycan transpeptidase YkuD (ErfK/YbiS/YcfS/YnhG family)
VATTVATTVPTTVPVKKTAPVTTPPHPTTPPAPAPLLVTRLVGVGSATQVIAVSASGYGQTVGTLTAFQHDATGWHQVFGPWQADVGYAGFAPPGQKHEGDGRTPSGSFGFDFFFGVLANPGVQFPFRPVTGPTIVWDDDPSSPLYNQWVDTTQSNAGAAPEPMDVTPAYDYGAVIAYNMSPTVPGAGSAIFLHVSDGGATTGCVSLPTSELLAVLRWLSPADQPRIIMGTSATIAP